uniref:Uncharacterized protein n=1 Tax=Bactrocera dorsalis TaxID=27457 RepID=A0A034VHB8_BACDO
MLVSTYFITSYLAAACHRDCMPHQTTHAPRRRAAAKPTRCTVAHEPPSILPHIKPSAKILQIRVHIKRLLHRYIKQTQTHQLSSAYPGKSALHRTQTPTHTHTLIHPHTHAGTGSRPHELCAY